MALKYLYVPSGYKAGTAYGVLPNESSADFDEFQRPSFATRTNKDGLLEIVDNHIPRIDYSDGGCPSWLLEQAETNLCNFSENILSWGTNPSNWGGTRTSNVLTSPDGSKSADLISVTKQSGVYMQGVNVTQGTAYSTSVYAKHISGTSILKFAITRNFHAGTGTDEKGIFVDLSDGSIISNTIGELATVKVVDAGNGWYRLCLQNHVASANANANVTCYAQDTHFSEYSLWGGQIETRTHTSSYIPNLSNGTTTRNNEAGNWAANIDGINSFEGVIEARFKAVIVGESNRITLGTDINGNNRNRLSIGYGVIGYTIKPFILIAYDGGGTVIEELQVVPMPSSFNIFEYNTYKFKFKAGNNELKINGELVAISSTMADLDFSFTGALESISLNRFGNNTSNRFNGSIKHIKVYDSITDF